MTKGPRLHCDFETRSIVNLLKLGVDVYARHWSTSPLMLSLIAEHLKVAYVEDFMLGTPGYQQSCYPFSKPGDLSFRFIRPPVPAIVLQALAEGWTFVAHNARFEQAIWYHICHKIWGWPMPTKWSCTAARARYNGIRASLDGATSDLEVLNRKNEAGKVFINDFCKPRKWKGAQKLGVIIELWKEPQDDPQGWATGVKYCLEDGYAEKDIDDILPDLPPFEQAIWELDFKINTRGLPIDIPGVERAISFSDYYTTIAHKRFDEITALRPTQRDRVLKYINQREEIEYLGDLRSKTLKRLVQSDMPDDLREVVEIRLEASQASIRKLETMMKCTDTDGRARGLFLYGGAHTMRWSAKRIQPQNFKRPDPALPASYLFEYFDSPCWGNTSPVSLTGGIPTGEMPIQPQWVYEAGLRFVKPLSFLSAGMRGFIQAPPGYKLVSGDYAQIEARVLAWLARCLWLLEAFRNRDDVYTRFAAEHMYPGEMGSYDQAVTVKNGKAKVKPQFGIHRQKAKSAQLGCGFGVGGRTFVEYCDNIGLVITLDEATNIVKSYRLAHPEIADYNYGLWARVERAVILAATHEGQFYTLGGTGVSFHVHRLDSERYWLICTLPSGRHIAYYRPKVRLGTKWARVAEILSFRTEWNGKSSREDTYGGKLVENMVQGIARDVCAQGALNAEAAGYPIVGLVHDEIISLPPIDFGGHDELCKLMCDLPEWVTDLPVEAEGATMARYGK